MRWLMRPSVSAALAMMVYGSWAAWVNRGADVTTSLKAFLVQGAFAFSATLLLSLSARALFRTFGETGRAAVTSFAICFGVLATVPGTLHWLAGTPNIVPAVLPGLIWGSAYLILVLRTLAALRHTPGKAGPA